ncbi:hypothetical protein JTB14_000915 [Gonioctena quinquepunctata]|nr:hypothetical protein JTB14_000915 [Gonioctena quinquepunctata]
MPSDCLGNQGTTPVLGRIPFHGHHQVSPLAAFHRKPCKTLGHWIMFFLQYVFEVVLNEVAHALSRDLRGKQPEKHAEKMTAVEPVAGCTWYDKNREEVQRSPEEFPD